MDDKENLRKKTTPRSFGDILWINKKSLYESTVSLKKGTTTTKVGNRKLSPGKSVDKERGEREKGRK